LINILGDALLQIAISVSADSCCADADESKHLPSENAGKLMGELHLTYAGSYNTSASSADSGKAGPELGERLIQDSTTAVAVVSIASSCSKSSSGTPITRTECHTSQTTSTDRHYSVPSTLPPLCVQSLQSSVICSRAALSSSSSSSSSSSLAHYSVRPSSANKHLDSCKTPVLSLDAVHGSTHGLLPDRAASRPPSVGDSPHPENNRHRSVKSGPTWFPTELQTSFDGGAAAKRRNLERSGSGRPCPAAAGGSTLNSPLKQFVDRHLVRSVPAPSASRSKGAPRFGQNGFAVVAPYVASSDQPMDLSVQRQKADPALEASRTPYRTHSEAVSSDEPLDLSQSVATDTRSQRYSAVQLDVEGKPPSGVVSLQNYCSRLLSGGYSLDTPLTSASSLSSFSSLVSSTVTSSSIILL